MWICSTLSGAARCAGTTLYRILLQTVNGQQSERRARAAAPFHVCRGVQMTAITNFLRPSRSTLLFTAEWMCLFTPRSARLARIPFCPPSQPRRTGSRRVRPRAQGLGLPSHSARRHDFCSSPRPPSGPHTERFWVMAFRVFRLRFGAQADRRLDLYCHSVRRALCISVLCPEPPPVLLAFGRVWLPARGHVELFH